MSALPNESDEFLFSPETMERITEEERRGVYNLERLKESKPEVIPEVLRLRGQWLSIKKIAKLCDVAVETVLAIVGQYADQIKNDHERRVQQIRSAADVLVEEILANPTSVPWSVKAPAACALYEKGELLAGRITSRVEEVQRIDIYAHWERFIAGEEPGLSGEQIPVREAELVDPVPDSEQPNSIRPVLGSIGAEIGFSGEKNSQGNSLPKGDPGNDEVHP
jgi:hypothetical protein